MTQTCEILTLPTPARRLAAMALPVLIEIPNLAAAPVASRPQVRRRRLRREVRVTGYVLLALFPLSLAIVSFGSDRFPTLAAVRPATPDPAREAPTISLSPLVSVERDLDVPVYLPGYLLPADTPEDTGHGGH